jgi:hypothetical protein
VRGDAAGFSLHQIGAVVQKVPVQACASLQLQHSCVCTLGICGEAGGFSLHQIGAVVPVGMCGSSAQSTVAAAAACFCETMHAVL